MINEQSAQAVSNSRLNDHFQKPLHDSYCFAQIPAMIEYLLTGEGKLGFPPDVLGDLPQRYQKVILLYVDAFGWRFFERYAEKYPFLKRFIDRGVTSKITSQFPSTTAAHISAIHTGVPAGESGIYEWYHYEPLLDCIIAPLIFSYAGDDEFETIRLPRRFDVKSLLPYTTLHQRLNEKGVPSTVFQHASYAYSTYSGLVLKGARISPFKSPSEALVHLAQAVKAEPGRAYYYLYFDMIDSLGHIYGPDSPEFAAEIDTFMTAVERLLHQELDGQTRDTLLLVTADHGQVNVSPQTTVYINQIAPAIRRLIKTNDEGRLLAPAGSPRDLFLHVYEDRLEEAYDLLSNLPELQGKAEVHRVKDLIGAGCFGKTVSQRFMERVGDLCILPYEGESVYWYQKGRYEQIFYGHHGGLTQGELEIPLLALGY